jgi:hypothetical protein
VPRKNIGGFPEKNQKQFPVKSIACMGKLHHSEE